MKDKKKNSAKDSIHVLDAIKLQTKDRLVENKPSPKVEQVEGFVSMLLRERGKIVPGSRREGKNIVTLAGREYYARAGSYSSYVPLIKARQDAVRYIGFGIGTTPEVSSVTNLVSPIAYDVSSGGLFLAELTLPSYPLQTSGSFGGTVRYSREYSETELSITTSVDISEAGLYTDGSPSSTPIPFTPGTRNLSIAQASSQAPNAYKTFEPLKKSQNFILQVIWDLMF